MLVMCIAKYFMYRSCTGIIMFYYYYDTVLHLSGYSGNGHFSIRVRVRVWYYFIFRVYMYTFGYTCMHRHEGGPGICTHYTLKG